MRCTSFFGLALLATAARAAPTDLDENDHPFILNVVDHEGNPANQLIQLHHRNMTEPKLSKRAYHPIHCAPVVGGHQYAYRESWCTSDRDYTCSSHYIWAEFDEDDIDEAAGSCTFNQLCIDDLQFAWARQAYCADIEGFVRLAELSKDSYPTESKSFSGHTGTGHFAEALITDFLKEKGMHVARMTISAQSRVKAGGKEFWHTLASSSCSHCYAVHLNPIPAHTARFLVDLTLAAKTAAGNLFIASV